MPKVSVVMPCYNHGKFLAESIEAVLCQTTRDLELIIVDDHSMDNSRDIIQSYERREKRIVPILHDKNMGASKSRNDALGRSRGDYIAFCDSDDVWMPGKLTTQIEHLANSPTYKIVYCDSILIDAKGIPTGERFNLNHMKGKSRSGNIFADLCLGNFINAQTVVLKKECLRDGECFNEQIQWVEDWMFWISLARKHFFLYVDEALAKYRVHSQSTGFVQRRGYADNRLKVYKEVITKYSDITRRQKSKILYAMGVCQAELGNKTGARGLFLRALLMNTTNFRALCRLLLVPKELSGGEE